jgi:molecular chaperone IbpA
VGFDRLFNELERTSLTTQNNYPPFNIIREDDSFYRIEVAVSGFSEDELSVELKESTLTVSGTVGVSDIEAEYLHKGISSRDFERNFTLNQDVVVNSAKIVNGLLSIELEHIIPEEKRPRKIEIGSGAKKRKKTLLTE